MHGARREDGTEPHNYRPGDYGKWDAGGGWYGMSPDGRLCNLTKHKVTEHDDGTITVSPSILVRGGDNDGSWHGYLEYGVWRAC